MAEESSPSRRPSLYTAIRLASTVQEVRQRLKSRVLTRAKSNAMLQCEALKGNSLDKAWRQNTIARVRDLPPNLQKKRRLYRAAARKDNNFTGLLQEIDSHMSPKGLPLSVVAAQDRLFLKHSAADVDLKHIRDASHILDVSTLLIERLQYARLERVWENAESKHLDSPECEKYLANLEHLLLCFQQAALDALIRISLRKLQSDYQHWDQYLEQQKKVNDGCFSEYSGDRPPLNSTMPWNIKPSLMVLWGVCWMFYTPMNNSNNSNNPGNSGNQNESNLSASSRQRANSDVTWNQHALSRNELLQGYSSAYTNQSPIQGHASGSLRHSPPNMNQAARSHLSALGVTGLDVHVTQPYHVTEHMYQTSHTSGNEMSHASFAQGASSIAPLQAPVTLPSQGSGRRSGSTSAAVQSYINAGGVVPSSSSESAFATLSPSWPQDPGSGASYAVSHGWQPSPGDTNISTPATQFSYPHSANSITSHAHQSFELPSNTSAPSQHHHNTSSTNYGRGGGGGFSQHTGNYPFGPSLNVLMGESPAYPSPLSEASNRDSSVCAVTMGGSTSPIMQRDPSSAEYSPESYNAASGFSSREPPRDHFGQIYCEHQECVQNPPTFSRKCEWSKHMDKHNRPYICRQPGCEKIRGFTYSGGLLRHEREVHKKYGGPKAPRFCPHQDCKRSTGTGFSRKENLHEHLRRVHRGVGIAEDEGENTLNAQPTRTTAAAASDPPAAALPSSTHTSPAASSPNVRKRKRSDGTSIKHEEADVNTNLLSSTTATPSTTTAAAALAGGDDFGGLEGSTGDLVEDLRRENKRLRAELVIKEERMKALEQIVFRTMRDNSPEDQDNNGGGGGSSGGAGGVLAQSGG